MRIITGLALAVLGLLFSRTVFEISYRLGFYPEKWLADLTMGMLSDKVAFWTALATLAFVIWIGLELVARRWLRAASIGGIVKRKSTDAVPSSSPDVIARDVWLNDAIWRAFSGEWVTVPYSERAPEGAEENQRFHQLVTVDLRQLAFDGRLPIWGKSRHSDLWELVPMFFWKDHHLSYLYAVGTRPEDLRAERNKPLLSDTDEWREFMTSRAAVDRIWPKTRSVERNHAVTQYMPPAPVRLFAKQWVLQFNPSNPAGRKNISFIADGTIGEGRNSNEYRWSYANDHLDIWAHDNRLHNRFKYDPHSGRFHCTNDLDAVGNKSQVIYEGRV